MPHAILLVSCPDARGVTAALTDCVYRHQGNILHADQHIDEQTNTFFMRLEWTLEGFGLERKDIPGAFRPIFERFAMNWELHFSDQHPRLAIFVSKYLHCLQDLLWRYQSGQLACQIPLVISNHPDARALTERAGLAFEHFVVTKENKREQELRQMALLAQYRVDGLVLARYHQILSGHFVDAYRHRIINIHHSFLPAFVGKNPYAQAYEKGVKIIGATAHFVTAELDQGPIIEQDVARISHRDSLADLVRKGEELERSVLGRAVRLYIDRRVLCYGNKTVVFD